MKKIYVLAAVALIASAACTKVELDESATPDVKIGYQVANYATQTKANGSLNTELTGLGISNHFFKSVAFINADDGNGGQAAPARFFNAATDGVESVVYNNTVPQWEPSHTYYWPKSSNSTLDFFSWYDMTEPIATAAASDHLANATYSYPNYTLAWSDRAIALKDNVMYADPVWNQKNNAQGTYQAVSGVSEGVPTLFHHALAQVRFQFKQKTMSKVDSKNNTYSTFWVVTVKNLAVPANKWVKTGSLSLSTTKGYGWGAVTNSIWTPGSAYWSSSDVFLANAAGSTGIVLSDAVDTFTKDNQMPGEYIAVLPQAIGNDFLLNFDITIETKYGLTSGGVSGATLVSTETIAVKDFPTGGAIVNNSGIQLNLLTTIGSYWQMNKKYTYVFEIDPETSTILYDPAVEEWATEISQTQTIPNA